MEFIHWQSTFNNFPIGYPLTQHPPILSTEEPHIVDGVPTPGKLLPMRLNSGNDMAMDSSTTDLLTLTQPNNAMSSMSDMPVSPTSAASGGHFPFTASEISGMGNDSSALNTAFTYDVASSVALQLPPDNMAGIFRDSLTSLARISWNFSL